MIDELFKEPVQWGLRGDPYLWKELKIRFEYSSISNIQEFEYFLIHIFEEYVGGKPKKSKDYFVKRFNFGGMSSGFICSDFWIEKGFPLLLKRYNKLNNGWTIFSLSKILSPHNHKVAVG